MPEKNFVVVVMHVQDNANAVGLRDTKSAKCFRTVVSEQDIRQQK